MSNVRVLNESIVPLQEVPELLPWPVSLSTVKHWARVGFRGGVLETRRIGRRVDTRREAVERFLDAVNRGPLPKKAATVAEPAVT